jgi:1-acyl-sn-glycerol-3-phosphate acyltransferase
MAAVKETLRRLKLGASVLIFPEGTRTLDGRIRALQPGIFAIARKAAVPIVPVVMEGAFEAWPRSAPFPRPGRIWVEYGVPLSRAWIAGHDPRDAATELTRLMRAMHNRLRLRMGRPPLRYSEVPQISPES